MLKNYRKQPRAKNWQSIKSKLDLRNEDLLSKNKFHDFKVIPAVKNWDAIHVRLAQPAVSVYSKTMRIAAALAVFLILFSIGADNSNTNISNFSANISDSKVIAMEVCSEPVIERFENTVPRLTATKLPRKKSRRKALKQKSLLDIILANDVNIESAVDSAMIADLLKPVDLLPEEEMFANLSGSYFCYQRKDYRTLHPLPIIEYYLEMPNDTINVFNFYAQKTF